MECRIDCRYNLNNVCQCYVNRIDENNMCWSYWDKIAPEIFINIEIDPKITIFI